MATALWRTEPQYDGHCTDGFYQTPDGRLRHRPLPDRQAMRRRLAALIGDDDEVPATVRAIAIDGQLPTAGQLAAVERELNKAPAKVLADFRGCGGQVEVVPHGQVYLHPVAKLFSKTPRTVGFCSLGPYYPPLIVVEADAQAGTALHECGHFVDREKRFSRLPEWHRLAAEATAITRWGGSLSDSDGGPLAGFFNARRNEAECFAEAFSVMYFSPRTRRHLSAEMQRFILRAST